VARRLSARDASPWAAARRKGSMGGDTIAMPRVIGGFVFEKVYHKYISWLHEPFWRRTALRHAE
jgi:hypothetical protein